MPQPIAQAGYDPAALREREYPMLQGEVYLDHTGATLYAQSALERYTQELSGNLFGNPHSESRSSRLSTARVDEVRSRTLEFFRADPEHFDLVFVQNATAAIKLVMEALAYRRPNTTEGPRMWFGYHADSHTSLVGVRQLADAGHYCFTSDSEVEMWLDSETTGKALGPWPGQTTSSFDTGLFAYPGQSNMTGRRLPLDWPGRLRRSELALHQRVFSLLDAAALASTAQLDFTDPDEAPDFTAVSFYKIFGFPDLGGLIVRKDSAHILTRRPYFGGGTVEMVVTCSDHAWHSLKDEKVHETLEDGTIPFHNIIALGCALETHQQLYGSQENVSRYTTALVAKLYQGLSALEHPNGEKVCEIYRDPSAVYGDKSSQGTTLAFNIRCEDGRWLKLSELEKAANEHHIHLRTGDVCNPGGVAKVLQLEPWESLRNYTAGVRCGCQNILVGYKPSGIARVSVGAMSTLQDVESFVTFIRDHYGSGTWVNPPLSPTLPPSPSSLHVHTVMVYPVRGCGAYKVPHNMTWPVTPLGLEWDRQWCIVDIHGRTILVPKNAPRLTLVRTEIDLEAAVLRVNVHRSLRTSQALRDGITVPLTTSKGLPGNSFSLCSNGHGVAEMDCDATDTVRGRTERVSLYLSPDVSAFFSAALGIQCTLGRFLDPECLEGPSASLPEMIQQVVVSNKADLPNGKRLQHENNTAKDRRPVALAELLRVNVLFSSHHATLGESWHYLRIGRRVEEDDRSPSSSSSWHLGRMKALGISAETRSPESFLESAPFTKIMWALDGQRSARLSPTQGMCSIRSGQVVRV